jgi:hypothetical protein
MIAHNNVSSSVAGYERAVHISEDGEFLSYVEYRLRRDGRTTQDDQVPVTHVVHEAPTAVIQEARPARPASAREKVTA